VLVPYAPGSVVDVFGRIVTQSIAEQWNASIILESKSVATGSIAAEENVKAERKRYENGMTTNFQVLQVQQQLTDARANELQALVGYNKAIDAFHHAVGDLLDTKNIAFEVPEVKEPSIFSRYDRYNWLKFSAHDNAPEEK
jgi:hypothetical protein